MMIVQGKIEDGRVVVLDDVALPEGVAVSIHICNGESPATPTGNPPRTLRERLGPVIGAAENLPSDASENVDFYLYGLPKEQ